MNIIIPTESKNYPGVYSTPSNPHDWGTLEFAQYELDTFIALDKMGNAHLLESYKTRISGWTLRVNKLKERL